MAAVGTIYNENCWPAFNQYFSQGGQQYLSNCCGRTYEYNQTVEIPNVQCPSWSSNYYPNRCTGPKTPTGTIGPLKIATEFRLEFLSVDDDLVVNGQIDQPNQHLVELGAGNTGTCVTFAGGMSICNGFHVESGTGRVLATLDAGETISVYGQDNHGIVCALVLTLLAVPVEAP
jgi:hypothetical protein